MMSNPRSDTPSTTLVARWVAVKERRLCDFTKKAQRTILQSLSTRSQRTWVDTCVFNPRHQAGVKQAYVKSVKARGIVESVRGEAWAVAPEPEERADGRKGPYLLLSCASLVEAFYQAIGESPSNDNLLATCRKGIEARVLNHRTPPSVCRYLTTLHNQFHHGAATNFLELIKLAPQASRQQVE